MKIFNTLFFIATIALLASSCTKDQCRQDVVYTKYNPIHATFEDIRSEIRSEAPRDLEQPGKIYFYQNHIFINEYQKGIHIIDNSDPENPTPISYIPILGNIDMVIKGNQLIVDNYTDLLTLDITNLNQVQLTNREENVFDLPQDEMGVIVSYTEEEVREEVQLSLKKPSFKIEKELTANVTLMLNQENEMIVISVDSDDKQLESFIKSRLNYKKIDLSIKKSGNLFKIPVRIVER